VQNVAAFYRGGENVADIVEGIAAGVSVFLVLVHLADLSLD
jgi:hypothetical protein